jgi:uncharacterized cupin superfamily protein
MLTWMDLGLQPESGLARQADLSLALFERGERERWGRLYVERPDLGITAGIWHSRPFVSKTFIYSGYEFIHFLSGCLEITTKAGAVTLVAGDSVMIPAGLECRFRQVDVVRKVFIRWDGPISNRDPTWRHSVWRPSTDDCVFVEDSGTFVAGRSEQLAIAKTCSPLLAVLSGQSDPGARRALVTESTVGDAALPAGVVAWAGLHNGA